ncbi:putative RNA-dependent RNA polymerase [Rosellinia necatrix]|nr:putative RNA-dependent RNA polymerase [Rosellinia necatrix]
MYALAPSVNTSRSSFVSKVFTETGDPEDHGLYPTTQETEVTVIAASSEHKFRPSPPSVVDCPVPSSSTKRALESSFGDCRNHQQNAGRLLGESVRSDESHPDPSKGLGKPSLDRHGHPMAITEDTLPKISHDAVGVASMNFEERLRGIWPTLPTHLRKAPLAVRWEIMRVALYCGVPMDELHFHYHPSWNDRDNLWNAFRGLDVFKDKSLPERSRVEAWNAAMSDHFSSIDQVVVLTASLTPNPSKHGLLFKLSLQPLKLDLPHRLDRRFGSDRFVEIVIPSLYTKEVKALSKGNESAVIDTVHNWLVEGSHFFLDRAWTSFYTKQATPKKIYKDDTLKPETVTIMQERVYMFAEDGNDFLRTESTRAISPRSEPNHAHTKMEREHLLEWLLQIRKNPKNQGQSLYKLFSRIALGLSRTRPTVILQHHQIRHCDTDILSPTGKVMNDGIGRMSTALVRQICVIMGLDDIPAGYQGRFGSAKGFWIRDTQDTSDDIWIETYPSQRKWVCDSEEEDHRTFEVRNASKELKSATLNLQLLPILEDRAVNALDMKKLVGKFMKDSLESEMESQKEAMKDPAHFKLWVHENTASQRRQERVRQGHVPWAAGLPTSREDQMEMLLTHGFDPTKLEFLRKIAYDMRKEKCEELQTKLNVKVGRSTYAYMVVDFSGVLEEGEVHLGFSSKFTDEQSGFSETFLHGVDVLVARTPAHYPSDIQRVKAVFKPELGLLKDVIIFSTKGYIPLADKLSGGDYDGDIAWVCWEPNIVNNFTNAPLPNVPDLFSSRVLSKVTNTYESLARIPRLRDVTTEFIDRAFRFNMEPSLLGTCTNYKEKLCYSRNSVRDEHAVFMSTLISHLVDRAKQGIVFSEQDWDRERKILNACQGDPQRARKRLDPLQPQYKHDGWRGDESPTHIIDYVKFEVGKPTVELELKKLAQYLKKAERFDADLVLFVKYYEDFKRPPALRKRDESSGNFKRNTWETVLDELKNSIDAVVAYWRNSRDEFEVKLANTHEKWQKIMPTDKVNSKTVLSLCEDSLTKVGLSQWDLLKASYCFKMYYKTNFPWYITGFQLAYLKSVVVSAKGNAPPILMTPEMYAGVRPDAKFIRAVAARNDGRYYNQASKLLEDVEDFSSEGE